MRYNSVLDLHTHTVASGHAYCSLREMAKAASEKGLEVLGITSMRRVCRGRVISFILIILRLCQGRCTGFSCCWDLR